MARTNGSSSNALKTALPALKAHVLTPANAPLLFAPYGPSDALPVCAIEPQIDGVMENRHKAVCMVIAEYVEACIGFHDVKAGRERRFEKRAGKHGLAQDGRHGNHDDRKREAIRITHQLMEERDAHDGIALLQYHLGDTARGYKIDDLCDAFLIALQAAIVTMTSTTAEERLPMPLRLAGFDIGSRNFAFCLLELCALRERPPSPDGTWRAPDPVFRLLDWGLYDLVENGVAVARHVVVAADQAPLRERVHEDIGDFFRASITLQAERQKAARKRASETRKRKRAEEGPTTKKKKKKARTVVLDLTAMSD